MTISGVLHLVAKTFLVAIAFVMVLLPTWSVAQKTAINSAKNSELWQVGRVVTPTEVAEIGESRCFSAQAIDSNVMRRMQGRSYPKGCGIKISQLRYLRVLHYDAEGKIHVGEMVCNRLIAKDLLDIFRELYRLKYPIERMCLIDDYGASDEQSMRANNTSCFCWRKVRGSRVPSLHARGLAVDINPLYNPCVRRRNGHTTVQPANARQYADRKTRRPYTLVRGDACHRLFTAHGFRWGGAWRSVKDYQHFEKNTPQK